MNLLDFLFPRYCIGCRRIGTYICRSCAKTMQPLYDTICPICERHTLLGKTHSFCSSTYSLDGLISFFQYQGVVKKGIKIIKYQFVSDIMRALILFAVKSQNIMDRYSFLRDATIIPIPLHPSRYRFRGFNQAEIFGKELSGIYDLSYAHDIIQRTKVSMPQVETKNKKERLKNMKDVFEVIKRTSVPKIVIVVDDVFTTGATMREAGRVLKKNGAQIVWGISIAR